MYNFFFFFTTVFIIQRKWCFGVLELGMYREETPDNHCFKIEICVAVGRVPIFIIFSNPSAEDLIK